MFMRTSISLILLTGILVAAGPVFAQDAGAGTEMSPGDVDEAEAMEAGAEEATEGTEEAISRVPTWEEAEEEPAVEEPPYEAFLRLAEDYIYRSEIGTRSVGRIPVWPRGAYKLGPVSIFPYLEGRGGWTNNVFQDATEAESWYVSGGGGLTAEYAFLGGNGSISGGADYRALEYFDEDLKYAEWIFGLGVGYQFPKGFWFKVGAKWERLVDPVRLEDTGLQRRNNLYPYIDLGMRNAGGTKVDVTLGFNYRSYDYLRDEDSTADREEYNAYVKLSYPVFRDKTRVYVRYDYRQRKADSDRINDMKGGHELSGGLEGVIPLTQSEKLVGTLSIGYRQDAWDSGTYRDDGVKFSTDDDDQKGIVTIRVRLRYLASARTSVELMYLRDLDFSSFSNYQVVDRFDLVVTHTIFRDLVARAGTYFRYSNPDSSDERDPVTEFGAGLGVRYLLMDNFDLDLALDWFDRSSDNALYDYGRFIGSLGVTVYFR